MVLQEADPSVTLTFLPQLDPQREKSPLLVSSNPDDRHIEEALAFRATHPGTRTAILTHDTGPILTAERVGLEPLEVPDAWLLEPEKDERQKQIEELTRQNKLLQNQHAQLSLTARNEHGETPAALILSITEYDPPSSDLVASVLADLRNGFPRQDDFAEPAPPAESAGAWSLLSLAGYSRKYQPPLPEEIERYHRDYDAWLTEAEAYLNAAPERLMTRTCFAVAVFRLENIGTKTGRSVQVDFTATPGFLLRPRARDGKAQNTKDHDLTLPRRPDPPQGKYVDNLGSWAQSLAQLQGMRPLEALGPPMHIASLLHSEPRDPTAFYYRDGRPHDFVQGVSLSCLQFRHRLEPKDFELEVQWQPNVRSTGGALRCRVSAENLPGPIELALPMRVTLERGDITAVIERLARMDGIATAQSHWHRRR
jgi:hypothetical protein